MKLRLVDMLSCPRCGGALVFKGGATHLSVAVPETDDPPGCDTCRIDQSSEHRVALVAERDCAACWNVEIDDGQLMCSNAHEFAIVAGVPRLLPETTASSAESIQTTYDTMWSHFQPGDKEWTMELEERVADFLPEVGANEDELMGALVLDAGCGPGTLTRAINRYGCESVGLDVSESVAAAHVRYSSDRDSRAHYVQGDLVDPPFHNNLFDVIYSGGVLHLNPDPEQAFNSLCRLLKPGGKMYIWVYGKTPGRRHAVSQSIRSLLSRTPQRLRSGVVLLWLPVVMARQYLRTLQRREDERQRLKWRERYVQLLDHYTPQYRWELSQEEVRAWFEAAGFDQIDFDPEGVGLGFGARGRLSSAAAHTEPVSAEEA